MSLRVICQPVRLSPLSSLSLLIEVSGLVLLTLVVVLVPLGYTVNTMYALMSQLALPLSDKLSFVSVVYLQTYLLTTCIPIILLVVLRAVVSDFNDQMLAFLQSRLTGSIYFTVGHQSEDAVVSYCMYCRSSTQK